MSQSETQSSARAKQYLQACQSLGQAEPALLMVQQLRGSHQQWLQLAELKHRKRCVTFEECLALGSYLSQAEKRQGLQSRLPATCNTVTHSGGIVHQDNTCYPFIQYISGSVQDIIGHDQQVLHRNLHDIQYIDRQLVEQL